MNFYKSAHIWIKKSDVPNTCSHASPNTPLTIEKGAVITVEDAFYRNAVFSGSFLLAEDVSDLDKSKRRVKVYCTWFGLRLKTTEPSLLIDLKTATLSSGGTVFTNLSR